MNNKQAEDLQNKLKLYKDYVCARDALLQEINSFTRGPILIDPSNVAWILDVSGNRIGHGRKIEQAEKLRLEISNPLQKEMEKLSELIEKL